MLARHEGRVILVQGGSPASVRARIGQVEQLAFAEAVDVIDPSADRREPVDLACGGCLYAHIGYERQRALKGEVVRDAFARLGRIEVAAPGVAASPSTYRMRAGCTCAATASVSIARARHDLCDAAAAATGQPRDRRRRGVRSAHWSELAALFPPSN